SLPGTTALRPGHERAPSRPPGRSSPPRSHPKVDAVAPVCVRRTGDQTFRPVDIAGYPARDSTGIVRAVRSALERDDLDRVACDSLGLRGSAHPGRVRPDDDDPLGHGISTPTARVAPSRASPPVRPSRWWYGSRFPPGP